MRRYKLDEAEEHYKKDIHDRLKSKYGITLDEYDQICERQGGRCAICGDTAVDERYQRLNVDHDHETGMVRGLLCTRCNRGLGLFRDRPELLNKAARYLKETKWIDFRQVE